jgi:hypothetical protein
MERVKEIWSMYFIYIEAGRQGGGREIITATVK